MKTDHIKERIGKTFNINEINSNDTLEVVSVNFKEQIYACKNTYDGQYDGTEFYYLDVKFEDFDSMVVI